MIDARYDDGSAMTDAHIRDELRTLLIAGHETTSIVLAWALYDVHRNAEIKRKLLAELDALGPDPSPDALAKLPYLTAVIDETLRLHPVIEVVFRVLRKPWQFGGYELPAGLSVAAAISLVHRREDLYPNPDAFEPEWFCPQVQAARVHAVRRWSTAASCIGAAFAHYEACVALVIILREFELELAEPREVPLARRSLTLGPKGASACAWSEGVDESGARHRWVRVFMAARSSQRCARVGTRLPLVPGGREVGWTRWPSTSRCPRPSSNFPKFDAIPPSAATARPEPDPRPRSTWS